MDKTLNTKYLPTPQILTVGQLLEKLQFEDVNHRIGVCVETEVPPGDVSLVVVDAEGDPHDLFVWCPPQDAKGLILPRSNN